MKKLFYIGVLGIAIFEVLKVYFIMPMPGSQEINSLDFAYFLHSYRWLFRIMFCLLIVIGSYEAFGGIRKWIPSAVSLFAIAVVYVFNFRMSADSMFKDPDNLEFKPYYESQVNDSSLIIGVAFNGEAKAYPIRYLSYHHKVLDQVGGKTVLVTYCNVCRSGRAFEPIVSGKKEEFRLVGMDHFNAMLEDKETKSWWRQATGEAVAGPLKGQILPEIASVQLTIKKFAELYPNAMIMQPDHSFLTKYDTLGRFEKGLSRNPLTRTDSLPWENKSWVVGIHLNGKSKAYDWNNLQETKVINDNIGDTPIVIALSEDGQSFVSYQRPDISTLFTLENDTLYTDSGKYDFSGKNISHAGSDLKPITAYQEFWHSWRTFQPDTERY